MPEVSMRIVQYAFVAALAFLFCCPPSVFADSADVVTLDFSGTGYCQAAPVLGPCPGTNVTGTYSFDPDTSSIVGSWSFSTPFGTLSSSAPGAYTSVEESASYPPTPQGVDWPSGYDDLDFFTNNGGVLLGFTDAQGYYGPITAPIRVGDTTFVFSAAVLGPPPTPEALFNLTSGTATPVAAPEPSALSLLAAGLLGLAFLRRGFQGFVRRAI